MHAVKVLALRRERRAGGDRFVWGYACSWCRTSRPLRGVPFPYIVARARLHSKLCSLGRPELTVARIQNVQPLPAAALAAIGKRLEAAVTRTRRDVRRGL